MARYRLAISEQLDTKPLVWGFVKGHHRDLFDQLPPATGRVQAALDTGEIDAAVVPANELVRLRVAHLVPDLCVACEGGNEAAVVHLTVPAARARKIAVDRSGHPAEILLPVVFAARFGIEVEVVPQGQPLVSVPADCDGALLRSEAALSIGWSAPHRFDLSGAWTEDTGLPFVSAAWVVGERVDRSELAFYFKSSLRFGLSALDIMARESAAELGLRVDRVRRYLERDLRFVLGERERAGLLELAHRAHAVGLTAQPTEFP